LDTSLFKTINSLAVSISWANPVFKFLAVYAVFLFGPLTLLSWWFARRSTKPIQAVAAAIWTALGTLLAVALNQLIAHAVERLRPYYSISHVNLLVAKANDFSFPSDHATTAGAVTAGLFIVSTFGIRKNRTIALISLGIALLIAFSRVYVGAHYPGDVTVGLVIGALIVVAGWKLLHPLIEHLVTLVEKKGSLSGLVIAKVSVASAKSKSH
jgi:undecaprenyl-diphosphatase